MKVWFAILVFTILAAATAEAAEDKVVPAVPKSRTLPPYPASCAPSPGETAAPQTVAVIYNLTKDGLPENVRAVESSDPCFEEVAVAAVRSWIYEPHRDDRRERPAESLETVFTFVFDEETETQSFDAEPKRRVPPRYPDHCQGIASKSEIVVLEFDVSPEGKTENIEIIDATNICFSSAAKKAVSQWRYYPKILDGKPAARKGVQTQITFRLSGGAGLPPEMQIRNDLRKKLLSIQKSLEKSAVPNEALTQLEKVEAEYGDTFSRAEMSAFYQIRGSTRLSAGEYPGALDDLRIVKRTGMSEAASEAISEAIVQLEALVAIQQTEAAVVNGAPPQNENMDDASQRE